MTQAPAAFKDKLSLLIAIILLSAIAIQHTLAQGNGVEVIDHSQVVIEFRQSTVDNLYYIACLQNCDYYFYDLADIANLYFGFQSEYAAHSYYMQVYSDYFNLSYVPLPPPPSP